MKFEVSSPLFQRGGCFVIGRLGSNEQSGLMGDPFFFFWKRHCDMVFANTSLFDIMFALLISQEESSHATHDH